MLKRTKGRILLSLLVITGFAGTLKNNTLTSQERKLLVSNYKESRTTLLKTIKELSAPQLNYRATADQLSISELFYQLVSLENHLWKKFDASMALPTEPEKRSFVDLRDESISENIHKDKLTSTKMLNKMSSEWTSIDKAVSAFKFASAKRVKYLRTTTGDLRNHFTHLPFGWIDNYQLILFIQQHSDWYFQQISAIISSPDFPSS